MVLVFAYLHLRLQNRHGSNRSLLMETRKTLPHVSQVLGTVGLLLVRIEFFIMEVYHTTDLEEDTPISYTSQQFLLCDNSSVANFISWAKAVSAAIAAMGWVQQNDTSQVVWAATVLTFTQVATNGTAVYSYSSYTGPAPRIGMSVVVSGFGTGGNNGTFVLTAVSGGASGTVTVTKTTQSNETHAGSGTTTVIVAVPASTYVYEIWSPGDAGTKFYFKMEYGYDSTHPSIGLSIATGTNGAGTLSGFVTTMQLRGTITNSGATVYECDFSGDTNRLGVLLWRNNGSKATIFAIERTKNVDGSDSADGVTLLSNNYFVNTPSQQTIVFGVGVGIASLAQSFIALYNNTNASAQFNNNIPMSPLFPDYGKYGNPLTVLGFVHTQDVAEGCFFTTTLYGSTRTYLASTNANSGVGVPANCKICLRYD